MASSGRAGARDWHSAMDLAQGPGPIGLSRQVLLDQEGFVFNSYQGCCELIVTDVPQGPEGQPGLDGASGLPGMKGEKVRGRREGFNTQEPAAHAASL